MQIFSIVLSSASQPVEPDTIGRLFFKQNDILSKADLYLLDEPFNNLDRKTTDFLQEIFDMKINAGAKIIFSSHDRSNDDFPLIDMNLFN